MGNPNDPFASIATPIQPAAPASNAPAPSADPFASIATPVQQTAPPTAQAPSLLQGLSSKANTGTDQGFTNRGNVVDNAADDVLKYTGMPAPEVLGALKGLAETGHTIGSYGSKLLNMAGIDVPQVPLDSPEYLKAHGPEQAAGKVGEGILEFFMGDEALKGLSLTDKLTEASKLTKLVEKYPTLAKALHIGTSALRMGTIGTIQSMVHGSDPSSALTTGTITAAAGGIPEASAAVRAAEVSPLLKIAARTAELGTGAGFAAKGATDALTPQQPGETQQQADERRVSGAIQALLGAHGVKESATGPLERSAPKVDPEDITVAHKDFKQAIPATKTTPYDDNDLNVVDNYLEKHHEDVQPIRSVNDTIDALNHEIKGIDAKVKGLVQIIPNEPIATNVLDDVRKGLATVSNKKGFVDRGMASLEKYDLASPKMAQADSIRDELNDDMKGIMKKNSYDRSTARQTSPAFAAQELAAQSLRQGVYQQLIDHGIGQEGADARELRLDEGSLIKVRNAAEAQKFSGDKAVKGTGDTSLGKTLGRTAITGGGAAVGGLTGSVLGPGGTGAGTAAGTIIGDRLANQILPSNDLTRDALIERRFGQKVSLANPVEPRVNLHAPAQPEPTGQQELPIGAPTLFGDNQTTRIPAPTPNDIALANSKREEPFQKILDDPSASARDKIAAVGMIDKLRRTPLPPELIGSAPVAGPTNPGKEYLAKNAADEVQRRIAPYNAILNDPAATAAQKAVVHGEISKIYKEFEKQQKEIESQQKEVDKP